MRHLQEWFKDNVEFGITIGIISLVILVYGAAKMFGFTANMKLTSANEELADSSYEKYNGINLTGSEVINAIKRYQDEIAVTVYTGESVDTYQGDFKVANNNRKSEKYIKPSQIYTGSLLKDSDKEIVGLVFAKEGIMLTDASYKELLAKIVGANPEEASMDTIVNQITSAMANKDATIAALTQNISSLNTSVSNLQSQNSTLNGKVSTLTSQLNTANSNYNSLSSDASAGKSAIASAITQKGVATSSTDSFSTMATNIGKISTGKLKCEEYSYSNDSIKKGVGLQLTVTTKNIVPQFVVISSGLGGTRTIASTRYSNGTYSFSMPSYEVGNACDGSITFTDNQVAINISPNNPWTGWYSLASGGTTTVYVYGV